MARISATIELLFNDELEFALQLNMRMQKGSIMLRAKISIENGFLLFWLQISSCEFKKLHDRRITKQNNRYFNILGNYKERLDSFVINKLHKRKYTKVFIIYILTTVNSLPTTC